MRQKKFDVRAAMKGRKLRFDPATDSLGFETPVRARRDKRKSIGILQLQPNLFCHYTASDLKTCGKREGAKRRFCGSAACPVCMRDFRRFFTNDFATLAQPFKTKRGNYGVVVTVIASGLVAPLGALKDIDLLAVKRRVSRGLGRLRLGQPIIGGVDVSFNEETSSAKPGHYQVHIAFAILGHRASQKARKRLYHTVASCFRLEPSAHVRVKVRPLRDPVRQGSYLLKSTYSRRVSYIASNGRRDTRKLPLKSKQLAEISLWLSRQQPLDRVLLHGIQLKKDRLVITTTANSTKKK